MYKKTLIVIYFAIIIFFLTFIFVIYFSKNNINKIKKMAWEESPTKSPQPKKITLQDVINVYKPKESNQRKKKESRSKINQGGKNG